MGGEVTDGFDDFSCKHLQQHLRRAAAERFVVESDGRQRRIRHSAQFVAAEAHDGDFSGHGDAVLMQRTHDADGQSVRRADDGAGAIGENLLALLIGVVKAEVRLHEIHARIAVAAREDLDEAVLARDADGLVLLRDAHEDDALMPHAADVVAEQASRAEIVGLDIAHLLMLLSDEEHRYVPLFQFLDKRDMLVRDAERRYEDAVNAELREMLDILDFTRHFQKRGFEQCPAADLVERLRNSREQLAARRRIDARHDDADHAALLRLQPTREGVRGKSRRRDRLLDALRLLLAHVAMVQIA